MYLKYYFQLIRSLLPCFQLLVAYGSEVELQLKSLRNMEPVSAGLTLPIIIIIVANAIVILIILIVIMQMQCKLWRL